MREIVTNHGVVVKVDDSVFDSLPVRRWHINSEGYAYGSVGGKEVSLHQTVWKIVTSTPYDGNKMVIDHIDGNKLNNQMSNLRLIDRQRNMHRGAKGVYFMKNERFKNKPWCARVTSGIGKERKSLFIQYFVTEEEAIEAVKSFKRENNLW